MSEPQMAGRRRRSLRPYLILAGFAAVLARVMLTAAVEPEEARRPPPGRAYAASFTAPRHPVGPARRALSGLRYPFAYRAVGQQVAVGAAPLDPAALELFVVERGVQAALA